MRVLVQHRRHHPAAAEVTQLLRSSTAWCTACHAHATLPPLPPRLHARGLSPLAARRASQETPRLIGQGDGVQATEAGSSPCGSAGSLQLVVNARPGHSSESLPTPWLRRPPTAPGRRPYAPQAPPQQALLWLQGTSPLGKPLPAVCADPQVWLQKVADQNQGG